MAVAENHSRLTHPVQQPLVVLTRLGGEAFDVGQRRAVAIKDAVELQLRLQRVEPTLLRAVPRLAFPQRRDDVRPVERRLPSPALAVPADPGRLRKPAQPLDALARMRAPGAVVAPEQVLVDAHGLSVGEHRVERREAALDLVQKRQHPPIGSHT